MEGWFVENHAAAKGIWLRLYKKDSGVQSIKTQEALEIALCYGWITGQAMPGDEKFWLARFVPRRPKSIWSKVNVAIVERLIEEGRMKPRGIEQVEEAKKDGRWTRAYNPPSKAAFPPDFVESLKKSRRAEAFSRTLSKANAYAIVFRIENAKDAKQRRAKIASIVEMLEKGETFH